MTSAPRITVHVPAYNYGQFLGDALDSLLAQTCGDWEAIVIDDASTDDTPRVLSRYHDPRVRVVRHDVNRGHIATYNEGIDLARGEYFAILSADDRFQPTFFERVLACFDQCPDADLVYTDAERIDADGRVIGGPATTLDPDHDWVRDLSVPLMFGWIIEGCGGVARTQALRELGGYDPAFPHTADLYLWRRLAFRGPVGHVTGRLLQHRDHPGAMHHSTTWLELMTSEEPQQIARLFRDPALPAAVASHRRRIDAALAVHRARARFRDGRYAAATTEFAAAVRSDPQVWQPEHPLRVFAREHAANRVRPRRGRKIANSSDPPDSFVHTSATVEHGARVGPGTQVWHHAHVRSGAVIGVDCTLGQNAFIDAKVWIGDRVKIENNASLHTGVTLADEVFVGPGSVFTNDQYPRAVSTDWEPVATAVGRGASIGANVTVVCGNDIGPYALVGAGSVVTRPVAAHELVVGNPARHAGWVCQCGRIVTNADEPPDNLTCERCS